MSNVRRHEHMFEPISAEPSSSPTEISEHFSMDIPENLARLLNEAGAGYSTRKELLIFGSEGSSRSLVEWNKSVGELGIYPTPRNGGPLWLAENCVGMQYGLRKDAEKWIYIAFDPNTFSAYTLATDASAFMSILLSDKDLVTLGGQVYPLIESIGAFGPAQHYGPHVSPMFGGSMAPSNWSVAPAGAHLAVCYEEFKASRRGA